ncbi:hypothetical protein [Streptomyces sp. SID3343]|uniref:hypothetical protein n=1 Tax=Streptomyces sp. SID3343 TaxID=2690260 RepID=UPI001367A400|nr:hypothetical protein [Streptomyces sp. SID3343]MYW01001.1 hypothetical protein [Streptomyces sp. SID3343]
MRGPALIAPSPDPHHRRPFGMVKLPYPVTVPASRTPVRTTAPTPALADPVPWYGADWR